MLRKFMPLVVLALGLLVHEYEWDRETLSSRDELTVSPEGHEALRLALRARAAG